VVLVQREKRPSILLVVYHIVSIVFDFQSPLFENVCKLHYFVCMIFIVQYVGAREKMEGEGCHLKLHCILHSLHLFTMKKKYSESEVS
jgi:hypothetical protein